MFISFVDHIEMGTELWKWRVAASELNVMVLGFYWVFENCD